MEREETPLTPAVYCGASQYHIHYDNFVLKAEEPMKPFMREEALEECSWLDMKKCTGSIGPKSFTLFPCVEYITMDECTIQNCSPIAFEPLEKLKALDIRNSKFPNEKNLFGKAKNLESLSISNFHFTDGDIFYHLKTLINLTLEHCTIDKIQRDMFSGLHSLKFLSISESEINEFTSDCLNDLENLEGLDIRDNKINDFDPVSILSLVKLERLSLHHNDIHSVINYEIFQQLPALQSFLFDNNIYESLDFEGFKTLNKVEIGYSGDEDNDVTNSDQITDKLKSMNIECQYVFCGKIDYNEDDEDIMCCY